MMIRAISGLKTPQFGIKAATKAATKGNGEFFRTVGMEKIQFQLEPQKITAQTPKVVVTLSNGEVWEGNGADALQWIDMIMPHTQRADERPTHRYQKPKGH